MRYFIEFAYFGKNFHGFQSQPNASSVQETIEKALSTLLREKIEIVGAGRTDSGVHASQMFAHFDSQFDLENDYWTNKLNSFLTKDISIHSIIRVHNDAHARFDAISRVYEYHIHTYKNPFLQETSWYQHQSLDIHKMNEACKILFEYEDFECFSKVHTDVNTFNCKIKQAIWTENNGQLKFTIEADRFLRNMVRAIVGTMINVGTNKTKIEDLKRIIESKNRNEAGFSVPAHGLFLVEIKYPYLTEKK